MSQNAREWTAVEQLAESQVVMLHCFVVRGPDNPAIMG